MLLKKTGSKVFFLIVALVFLPGAKVYKWVDENGKKHFSSVPPNKSSSTVSEQESIVSNSGGEPAKLEHVFKNTWYAFNGRDLIEFTPSEKTYSWILHKQNFNKKRSSGKWSFDSGSLKLKSMSSGVDEYRVSGVSKFRMTLTNLETKQRYRFVRNKEPRYNLSSTENKIEGIWTELDPYGKPIARVRFDSGLFTRYYLPRGANTISSRYNKRNVLSKGSWHVSSSNFILSYAQSYGKTARKTATEESWIIKKVSNDEMLFTAGGNKVLRFKR